MDKARTSILGMDGMGPVGSAKDAGKDGKKKGATGTGKTLKEEWKSPRAARLFDHVKAMVGNHLYDVVNNRKNKPSVPLHPGPPSQAGVSTAMNGVVPDVRPPIGGSEGRDPRISAAKQALAKSSKAGVSSGSESGRGVLSKKLASAASASTTATSLGGSSSSGEDEGPPLLLDDYIIRDELAARHFVTMNGLDLLRREMGCADPCCVWRYVSNALDGAGGSSSSSSAGVGGKGSSSAGATAKAKVRRAAMAVGKAAKEAKEKEKAVGAEKETKAKEGGAYGPASSGKDDGGATSWAKVDRKNSSAWMDEDDSVTSVKTGGSTSSSSSKTGVKRREHLREDRREHQDDDNSGGGSSKLSRSNSSSSSKSERRTTSTSTPTSSRRGLFPAQPESALDQPPLSTLENIIHTEVGHAAQVVRSMAASYGELDANPALVPGPRNGLVSSLAQAGAAIIGRRTDTSGLVPKGAWRGTAGSAATEKFDRAVDKVKAKNKKSSKKTAKTKIDTGRGGK